jgi:uncharacterized FlgJ-related protein
MKKLIVSLISVGITSTSLAISDKLISKKEYIDQWRSEAIRQMNTYKIPASVTLAQAILESSSGNSKLAREGNNHFGIKCHNWTGKSMNLDDDKPNECFRVYGRAEESYEDHSQFLVKNKRYAELFQFQINDYASWAKGLKKAGYATSPNYAVLLIDLIEDLQLYRYDGSEIPTEPVYNVISAATSVKEAHAVVKHENRVNYIVAKKGDTYVRIAKEFKLALWQLYKYNDFSPKKDMLSAGDIVFIQPKRRRGKKDEYIVKSEITLRELSQKEAVQLNSLLKRNNGKSEDIILRKGEKVILR